MSPKQPSNIRFRLTMVVLIAMIAMMAVFIIYQGLQLNSLKQNNASFKENITSAFSQMAESCSSGIASLNKNMTTFNSNQIKTDNNITTYGIIGDEHWAALTSVSSNGQYLACTYENS